MAAHARDRLDDSRTRRSDCSPRRKKAEKTRQTDQLNNGQNTRYKNRNVVERCLNQLKQWRGIAMRSDKTARTYQAAIYLAATLILDHNQLNPIGVGRAQQLTHVDVQP